MAGPEESKEAKPEVIGRRVIPSPSLPQRKATLETQIAGAKKELAVFQEAQAELQSPKKLLDIFKKAAANLPLDAGRGLGLAGLLMVLGSPFLVGLVVGGLMSRQRAAKVLKGKVSRVERGLAMLQGSLDDVNSRLASTAAVGAAAPATSPGTLLHRGAAARDAARYHQPGVDAAAASAATRGASPSGATADAAAAASATAHDAHAAAPAPVPTPSALRAADLVSHGSPAAAGGRARSDATVDDDFNPHPE